MCPILDTVSIEGLRYFDPENVAIINIYLIESKY
jgi:hypothetical protein